MSSGKPPSIISSISPTNGEESYGGDANQEEEPLYTTWADMIRHWPWTTFCIVSNEFCERFSFYGMRTVLTLYILNVLKFNDRIATVFFNGFTVLCYFTPVAGAIIADGFIGMFYTIFSISLIYAAGQILLAVASTQNADSTLHPWLDLLGLCIIGIGTGGIKPCVAPFGATQFNKIQVRMISVYFSMFYFAINAGSMISTFISPLLRAEACMGQDSCYPLAFGIPAILMVTATVVFAIGSYWYIKPPVKDNVFADFSRTIIIALRNKWKSSEKCEHWMDHFLETHSCDCDQKCLDLKKARKNENSCQKRQFVKDSKSLIRVLIIYLPVPMFWALYDQQGSAWTIQAVRMDCRLWGDVFLLPDQMQTLNAVLILVFIPLFQVIIYPLVDKCINFTPLRRMVVGGVLAAGSFVIAGLIQLQINTTVATVPNRQQSFLSVMNTLNSCDVTVTVQGYPGIVPKTVPANYSLIDDRSRNIQQLFHLNAGRSVFELSYAGHGCKDYKWLPPFAEYNLQGGQLHVLVLNNYGTYLTAVNTDKPTNGNGEFAVMFQLAMAKNYTKNLALCQLPSDMSHFDEEHPCDPENDKGFVFWEKDYDKDASAILGTTTYQDGNSTTADHIVAKYAYRAVRPGIWRLYYMYNYMPKRVGSKTLSKYQIYVNSTGVTIGTSEQGAVFLIVLTGDDPYNAQKHVFQAAPSNTVSILWQIPQYVVITAAEILFSITGIEFAYSQAAPSMKSIVQALWLLTSSIGDLIIVLIALWNPFSNMATEYFVYAGAMLVIMLILALLSIFYYDYNYYTGEDSSESPSLCIKNDVLEEQEKEMVTF